MPDYFKVSWVHSGGPLVEEVDYPPPTVKFKYRANQETSSRRAELTEQLQQFFKTRGLPLMGRVLYVSRTDGSPVLEWTESEFTRPF